MVRKQVYLAREQERKLRALAAKRGCTEAAVIRDALDRLPDPSGSFVEQLAAAGLLLPKGEGPIGDEASALQADIEAWLASRGEGLGLSDALRADRSDR